MVACAVIVIVTAVCVVFFAAKPLILKQNIASTGVFRLDFPAAMNHVSVEQYLSAPSYIHGTTHWEGETLVYAPQEALEKNETIVLRLNRNAAKADGTLLGRDLDFTFVVTGPLAATAHVPSADAQHIDAKTNITITFDRPVVALGSLADQAMPSGWNPTITPSIAGQWRWMSTHAVQFVPASGLTPATVYAVKIPAGLQAASGGKTEQDIAWQFETERPAVTDAAPAEADDLAGPTTALTLTFNQEIDLRSIAKHLELYAKARGAIASSSSETASSHSGSGSVFVPAAAGTQETIASVHYGTSLVNGKDVIDKHVVTIVAAHPLSFDTDYTLRASAGLHGLQGDLGSAGDFLLHFATVGPLAVANASFESPGLLTLKFSNPILQESLTGSVRITPSPAGWKDLKLTTNSWDNDKSVSLYPAFDPSTSYTLTIDMHLTDGFGQTLAAPYTYTFKTPPLPPAVTIHSKGTFGIFEKSKAPVYYVNAVNVSSMDFEFAKLSVESFLKIRQQERKSGQSAPDLRGSAEYHAWSVAPKDKKLNAWSVLPLDMSAVLGKPLEPGIYALIVHAPEFMDNGKPRFDVQYFALTDTALTLKYSGKKALVWAVNMQTGEPVAGADVAFHALNGQVPVTGKTDAKGFLETDLPLAQFSQSQSEWRPEFWVSAAHGNDMAFVSSEWNDGLDPSSFSLWSDFQSPGASPYRTIAYLYTDRPVYRPGDTASFKGVVRLKDWDGILQQPGAERTALVKIQDPDGKEVYSKTLHFTSFGSLSDTFPVSQHASLGTYNFVVQVLPEADAGTSPSYMGTFSVLAYRKPEYKVDLTPAVSDYEDGQTVSVDVAGSYYFGAPLSNASVTWNAELTDYYFNRYTDGWYSFATEGAWCWYNCSENTSQLTTGKGTLDDSGHMTIRFPVSIADKKISQIASISASVTDPNNQQVTNSVSVPVHKSNVYVGVRTSDYIVTPGGKAGIDVVTVQPDGSPQRRQTVTLSLYSRMWNSIRAKGVDGEYYYDNTPQDAFVRSITLTTDDKGKGHGDLMIDKGGEFFVRADAADDAGRTAQAGVSLYAWSSSFVNWPHTNNDRIDVTADKPSYMPGETAKLLVKSPYQGKGVTALVTIERENVLQKKIVPIVSNAQPIEIKITDAMTPNVYVSVVILKPRQGDAFDTVGHDTGAPAFKVGYVRLGVDTKHKELQVTVETDQEKYIPGDTVKATVHIKDANGKPVRAEASLATVDMSVLALSGFEMPDLVRNFYEEHGLGIYTAESLQMLLERFKPGSKGGGGSQERKRGNFQDTAYWNPTVVTDATGTAVVSFKLPDNLTTWQLLAIAQDDRNNFGQGKKEFLETKHVIIRPVEPRFAVQGDQIKLGAIVHNFLDRQRTFTIGLSGSGFATPAASSQQVSIDAGKEASVAFPVTIAAAKTATKRRARAMKSSNQFRSMFSTRRKRWPHPA